MIIYPPYIEGTIPAFTNGKLKTPFQMNPAVVSGQVRRFVALIKNAKEKNPATYMCAAEASPRFFEAGVVEFDLSTAKTIDKAGEGMIPEIGQYYKVQLAYDDSTAEIDPYKLTFSSVGITKCTATPNVYVEDLSGGSLNVNSKKENYKGIHISTDPSEPEYEYLFEIKDNNSEIFATSGWQIHDGSQDGVALIELFENGVNGFSAEFGENKAVTQFEIASNVIEFTTNSTRPDGIEQWLMTYRVDSSTIAQFASEYYTISFDARVSLGNPLIDIRAYGGGPLGSAACNVDTEWKTYRVDVKQTETGVPDRILIVLPFGKNGVNWDKYANRTYQFKNFHCTLADDDGNQIIRYNNGYDEYQCPKELEEDKNYTLTYTTRTVNGLVTSSPAYNLMNLPSIEPTIKLSAICSLNYDEGYVSVDTIAQPGAGKCILYRANSEDNYSHWDEITHFAITDTVQPTSWTWLDRTVKHGVSYQYAYVQYNNNGIYSNKVILNEQPIEANFEDIFLGDAERQLKIRFNPKISSFKTTLLESKVDTIGGKYPFFFRNGLVGYKEFPISGLISYQQDKAEMFMTKQELGLSTESALRKITASGDTHNERTATTNLVDYNIMSERLFKLAVLDWLNNGKPKLFRSPAEGNYIVRLMNISLNEDDKLSRMLATFNCMAYEIAEDNYENYRKNNLVNYCDKADTYVLGVATAIAADYEYGAVPGVLSWTQIADNVLAVHVEGMTPGDRIKLGDEEIVIGLSGTYSVNTPALAISLANTNSGLGQVTYEYALPAGQFDKVSKIRYEARLKTIERCGLGDNQMTTIGSKYLLETNKESIVKMYNMLFEYKPENYTPEEGEALPERHHYIFINRGPGPNPPDLSKGIDMSIEGQYSLNGVTPTQLHMGQRVSLTAYYLVKIVE